MNSDIFVSKVRSWAESMQARDFATAYQDSLDIYAVGLPLTKDFDLSEESLGLEDWGRQSPEQALQGLFASLMAITVRTLGTPTHAPDSRQNANP